MKIVVMGKIPEFWKTRLLFNVKPYFCLPESHAFHFVMKLSQILTCLEEAAPPVYQESYDNAGLLTGDQEMEITGALICLDSTEAVLDEAVKRGCNLVIAHHPIIFNGLKKITGRNYVERTILKAIRQNIAIYAMHTNLDNVRTGVNAKIGEKLGLSDLQVLEPKKGLLGKLVTFVPAAQAIPVRDALFRAGAGHIGNYDSCSFSVSGTGTFRGNADSHPYTGVKGKLHLENEIRMEVIFERRKEKQIIGSLLEHHPYEEVAYDCFALDNAYADIGSGLIGKIKKPVQEHEFLSRVKKQMQTACIRHTAFRGKPVSIVAVAGGAGSFLLPAAMGLGADFFITADFKYHQFFDADNRIVIADIGHYESEQFTKELIYGILIKKFSTFAVHLSEINTNPVNYF